MSCSRSKTSLSSAGSAAKRRADHAMENAEDYVELIEEMQHKIGAAHVTDIAAQLGVSHVTVHKTIKRLKALGLVYSEPYRAICLTENGRALARESRERHEVTLRFLQHLGLESEEARNDAEGIEHHVGSELLARMKFFCDQMERYGQVTRRDLEDFGSLPESGTQIDCVLGSLIIRWVMAGVDAAG